MRGEREGGEESLPMDEREWIHKSCNEGQCYIRMLVLKELPCTAQANTRKGIQARRAVEGEASNGVPVARREADPRQEPALLQSEGETG